MRFDVRSAHAGGSQQRRRGFGFGLLPGPLRRSVLPPAALPAHVCLHRPPRACIGPRGYDGVCLWPPWTRRSYLTVTCWALVRGVVAAIWYRASRGVADTTSFE